MSYPHAPSPVAHVVPVAPVTGRIPEALDRRLGALALAAQDGDATARDAVYAAIAPRLDIIVRSVFRRCDERTADPAIELDDLRQEGYLILVDLVERWQGDATVCEHVLSRFHWRLRAAYVAMSGTGPRGTAELTEVVGLESIEETTEPEAGLIGHLTECLPERQRAIVLLRVVGGYRQRQVADALKIGRSTLTREWDRALATLRHSLQAG